MDFQGLVLRSSDVKYLIEMNVDESTVMQLFDEGRKLLDSCGNYPSQSEEYKVSRTCFSVTVIHLIDLYKLKCFDYELRIFFHFL